MAKEPRWSRKCSKKKCQQKNFQKSFGQKEFGRKLRWELSPKYFWSKLILVKKDGKRCLGGKEEFGQKFRSRKFCRNFFSKINLVKKFWPEKVFVSKHFARKNLIQNYLVTFNKDFDSLLTRHRVKCPVWFGKGGVEALAFDKPAYQI